jgi:hypothetical protein
MPKQGKKFVLSSAEESQLHQLIRAQRTPQGLAQRARVVQLAAQGMGVRPIGGLVGLHYNQVAKWRRRYLPPVARISQANRPRNSFEPAHPHHSG